LFDKHFCILYQYIIFGIFYIINFYAVIGLLGVITIFKHYVPSVFAFKWKFISLLFTLLFFIGNIIRESTLMSIYSLFFLLAAVIAVESFYREIKNYFKLSKK